MEHQVWVVHQSSRQWKCHQTTYHFIMSRQNIGRRDWIGMWYSIQKWRRCSMWIWCTISRMQRKICSPNFIECVSDASSVFFPFLLWFWTPAFILHLTAVRFTYYRVVCCVQFSADGRYVATGCNRTAQIFDVQTGQKVWYVLSLYSPTAPSSPFPFPALNTYLFPLVHSWCRNSTI